MNKINALEFDYHQNSKALYIFMGGIAAGIAVPPFEFYRSASILDENKIFIRDLSQMWYLNGLPGVSKDIYETAEVLKNEIEKLNVEKVYWVGNSMGGWAAIALCKILGIGQVIAFAPQTTIDPLQLLYRREFRWVKQISKTYIKTMFKHTFYDLKKLFLPTAFNAQVSIFVDSNNRLDYFHAKRLAGEKGVSVFEFKSGGHEIVKHLKAEGLLSDIMQGRLDIMNNEGLKN